MYITDVEKNRFVIKKMIVEQINKLNKKIPGQAEVWRHVYYMYGTEHYNSAIRTLNAYLSDIELRKLNITYMQQYCESGYKECFQFLYRGLLVRSDNTEAIKLTISKNTKDIIEYISQTRETLAEYLITNKILNRNDGSGEKRWYNEKIAFCTFHHHCMTYGGVVSQQCLHRNGANACKHFVIIQNLFWRSTTAERIRRIYRHEKKPRPAG